MATQPDGKVVGGKLRVSQLNVRVTRNTKTTNNLLVSLGNWGGGGICPSDSVKLAVFWFFFGGRELRGWSARVCCVIVSAWLKIQQTK